MAGLLLSRPLQVVDRKIEGQLKNLIPLLGEEGFVVALFREVFIQNRANFVAHGEAGLTVLEPILDKHFG